MKENKPKLGMDVAQTLEAGENFVNGVKNPLFVLILIIVLGVGYFINKFTPVLIDKITVLSSNVQDNTSKLSEVISLLKDIKESLK